MSGLNRGKEMEKSEKIKKQIDTLKRTREILGMNRTQFSQYMEIPLRTLEEWEAGRRQMPDYVLLLIAYYVRVQQILEEKGIEVEEADYEQE